MHMGIYVEHGRDTWDSAAASRPVVYDTHIHNQMFGDTLSLVCRLEQVPSSTTQSLVTFAV